MKPGTYHMSNNICLSEGGRNQQVHVEWGKRVHWSYVPNLGNYWGSCYTFSYEKLYDKSYK